jgi:signal peptidase I
VPSSPILLALLVGAVGIVLWVVLAREPRIRRQRLRTALDIVATLLVAGALAWVVQAFVIKPYRIPSASMEQTLLQGDRIVAARFLYRFTDPERGDIVVFHPNGVGTTVKLAPTASTQTFVKRIVGMPGEWIEAKGGRVRICTGPRATRCHPLSEPYARGPQAPFGPIKIPAGRYFMMGDNRSQSLDSRAWGPIAKSQMIGKVFMTYWPLTRIRFF